MSLSLCVCKVLVLLLMVFSIVLCDWWWVVSCIWWFSVMFLMLGRVSSELILCGWKGWGCVLGGRVGLLC